MDKFEEAICGHNPLYKEGLQDKYYQGAKWAWQSRQSEFDAMTEALLNQTQLLAKQKVEIEEKDKRIEAAVRLMDLAASDGTECVEIGELYQALRGEHE